jgi:hypothetical protein
VKLISPTISAVEGLGSELCFSFWFAAFGAGDSTVLKIIRYGSIAGLGYLEVLELSMQILLLEKLASIHTVNSQ